MSFKVLTIEDQDDIRLLIRMTLEFEGFHVAEAATGELGLALAKSEKPDLILLDVMMPGISGLTVSQELRANTSLNHIPVVMLSAKGQPHDIVAGHEAGAAAYLVKPFRPTELLELVERLITKGRAAR